MASSSKHVQKLSATKQKFSMGEVKKAEKAKAVANRKVVRTTVVNPDDVDWPPIELNDEKELLECLNTDLRCLKFPNYHVPLSEIKKVEKSERRKFRNIWLTEKSLSVGFDVAAYAKIRADISLGVNCVSSAIEQDLLIGVIIEKDVDPSILTKLLIPLARSKGVPIVAISGLNKTCQDVFKTRCIAMGLKTNCSGLLHSFNRISTLIRDISAKEQARIVYSSTVSSQLDKPCTSYVKTPESSELSDPDSKAKQTTSRRIMTPGSAGSDSFKPPKIRRV